MGCLKMQLILSFSFTESFAVLLNMNKTAGSSGDVSEVVYRETKHLQRTLK